jgi:hypothetical protein
MNSHQTHDKETDPTLVLFSDEAQFNVSGYVNSLNNMDWSAENPMLIHKVPLHDIKFGCGVLWMQLQSSGTDTINSHWYFNVFHTMLVTQ